MDAAGPNGRGLIEPPGTKPIQRYDRDQWLLTLNQTDFR
jgi:hypothetical protein